MDDFDAAVSATLLGTPAPAAPAPAQAARYGMQQAVGTNPDLQAELQRVAVKTGVPVSTVAAQPEEMKRQATMGSIDFDGLATSAPSTAALLADVEKAKVAHDDIGTLAGIEQGLRSFMQPGTRSLTHDLSTVGRAIASGFPKAGAGVYGLAAAPFELLGLDSIGGYLRQQQRAADAFGNRISPTDPNAGLIERGVISGLQSAGQNLAMLPLGIFGGEAAMLGSMGAITGGQSYGKARDAGLSPARAIPYAMQDAVAEVVTEKYLGAAGFLHNVQAGASAGKLFMYELAKEVPGEIAATLWQNFNEWTNVNPKKSVADFIHEQPAAVAETIIATLVGGTTQIGAVKAIEHATGRVVPQQQQAQQGEQHAAMLQDVVKTIAASKTLGRDQTTFEGFLQSATEDGPLEKLYINPADLQKAGVDLTQLAAVAPSIAPQIQQALETGADISVPTAELLTRLPGTPLEQSLVDHLKTDPGGFSRAGAQVFMQEQGETVRQQVEAALNQHAGDSDFMASAEAVKQDVMRQLSAANRFTDEVNEPYAALWGNVFGVYGARAGVMPKELYDRYAPRIVAQTPESAATLDQELPPNMLGQQGSVGGSVSQPTRAILSQPGIDESPRVTTHAAADHPMVARSDQQGPEVTALRQREDTMQKLLECLG